MQHSACLCTNESYLTGLILQHRLHWTMSLLSCPHCFWAWGHASPVVICFYISSPSLEHSPWGDWTLGKPYLQPFWADTSPGAECSGAVAGFPDLHLPLQLVPGPFLFFLSSSAFLLLLSPSSLPFSPFPPSLILSLLQDYPVVPGVLSSIHSTNTY